MSSSPGRKLGATLILVLAALATAWTQPNGQQQITLNGRLLAGFGEVREAGATAGGPVTTIDADLTAFLIDPRVLKGQFNPTLTFGQQLPETSVGGSGKGFLASGTILGGSHFPLTLSYSRLGQDTLSLQNRGILAGVETSSSTRAFSAHWQLNFPHFPIAQLEYRSTDSTFELPKAFGRNEENDAKTLSAKLEYRWWGWQVGGAYLRSRSKQTSPQFGKPASGMLHDAYHQKELRLNASRSLPLHSDLSIALERDNWNYDLAVLKSRNKAESAHAALTSRPLARVTTNLQARYTSNSLESQAQQALGENLTGSSNPVSLTLLPVQYSVSSFAGGAQVELGHGFWAHGNAGAGHASGASESTNWSAGLSYQHKLRSGFISANYSRSHSGSQTGITSLALVNTAAEASVSALLSRVTNAQTGTVTFNRELPAQFKLNTSLHVSFGTLEERGTTYPNREYGQRVELSRLLGRWTLTGSFDFNTNNNDYLLLHDENTAKSFGLLAQRRGLQFSFRRQYNDGLALQMGNSFLWIAGPQAVSPLLAKLTLNSTAGTTVAATYAPGRGRLSLMGSWSRLNYTANNQPRTNYSLLNVTASYRLRRISLIAGYMRQSQMFILGPLNNYERGRIYFQVERRFHLL